MIYVKFQRVNTCRIGGFHTVYLFQLSNLAISIVYIHKLVENIRPESGGTGLASGVQAQVEQADQSQPTTQRGAESEAGSVISAEHSCAQQASLEEDNRGATS